MRSLWLASTALLITTGIACAQSTQTAAPAPTGAVTAPQVTPSGTPGNMAPAPSSSSVTSSNMPSSASTPSPAPNGAASAPDVTAGAAPGTAPGKMSTASNSMSASDSTSSSFPTHFHHHWSSTTTLPQNASATTYLHIARSAIWHHNVTLADDALSHAETDLLNRSVPQGQISADNSPPVQSIESARQALHAGNYSQASLDTKQAASAVNGI